jgi:quercetin dioxygenase-like cupin family protein
MAASGTNQPPTAGEHRTRPVGQTTGSAERPAQRVAGPVLVFDLAAETEQLRREPALRQNGRNAKTLVKEPDFRIVLVAMEAGARMDEHQAAGSVSLHALSGHLRVHLPSGQVADLPTGHLIALEAGVRHDVEAVEPSAFLLTVAWR